MIYGVAAIITILVALTLAHRYAHGGPEGIKALEQVVLANSKALAREHQATPAAVPTGPKLAPGTFAIDLRGLTRVLDNRRAVARLSLYDSALALWEKQRPMALAGRAIPVRTLAVRG